jgi:hypothetical protein
MNQTHANENFPRDIYSIITTQLNQRVQYNLKGKTCYAEECKRERTLYLLTAARTEVLCWRKLGIFLAKVFPFA